MIILFSCCSVIDCCVCLMQWPYEEFISIVPTVKAPTGNEFTITMKKNSKKTDTMRFSTDHRADLLTEALKFRHLFAEKLQSSSKVRLSNCLVTEGWLGSRVVSMLDSGTEGPGFKSQPPCCRVTVLGKLFTSCLCSPSSKIGSSLLKGCGVTTGLTESNGSLP